MRPVTVTSSYTYYINLSDISERQEDNIIALDRHVPACHHDGHHEEPQEVNLSCEGQSGDEEFQRNVGLEND